MNCFISHRLKNTEKKFPDQPDICMFYKDFCRDKISYITGNIQVLLERTPHTAGDIQVLLERAPHTAGNIQVLLERTPHTAGDIQVLLEQAPYIAENNNYKIYRI
jgi:hypothetical protein